MATVLFVSYGVIALVILDPRILFSIDAGVKLLQAEALRASAFTSIAIPYPAAAHLDPDMRFVPFRPPFVFLQGGEIHGVYPATVAWLNALALSFGLPGLVALSLLSSLAVLFAVAALSATSPGRATLILGAGTSFWAYGVLAWEHMPALACSTGAMLVLSRHGDRHAVVAGLLLGVATALRHESALMAPGLVAMFLWRASWGRIGVFSAAAAAPLLGATAIEVSAYGRAPFSHLAHAVDVVWRWTGTSTAVARPEAVPLAEQADIVAGAWLTGLPGGTMVAVTLAAVLGLACLVRGERREVVVIVVLAAAGALLVHDLVLYASAPSFVAGLLRGSPVLVFAFLPVSARVAPGRRLEVLAFGLFTVGLLASGRYAGAQIGPRFLLPVLPLLVKMACDGLADSRNAASPAGRAIGALGAFLLAGSVALQAAIVAPALVALNSAERPISQSLVQTRPVVLLIGDPYLLSHAAPAYRHSLVMLATNSEEAEDALSRLEQPQALVGVLHRAQDQRFGIPGWSSTREVVTPHTVLVYWRRAAGEGR